MAYNYDNSVPFSDIHEKLVDLDRQLGVLHGELATAIDGDRRVGRLSAAGDRFAILKAATEVYRKALAAVQEGREYRPWK